MSSQDFKLVETTSERAPWYRSVPKLRPKTQNLLTTYSNIKTEDIDKHLMTYREKAWAIRPYPCVGMWNFLKSTFMWSQLDDEYDLILQKVKAGEPLLDVGCGIAQDLRFLAYDGSPTQNLFVTDLTSEFFDSSFDLFRDRQVMEAQPIFGDFLDPNSELMRRLEGSVDIIMSGDFLHLFDWERQVQAASLMIRLSKPKRGSMVIGKQIGRRPAEAVDSGFTERGVMFMHDEESFRKMWKEAVGVAGSESSWTVRTRMATMGEGDFWGPKEDFGWFAKGSEGFQFVIMRESDE